MTGKNMETRCKAEGLGLVVQEPTISEALETLVDLAAGAKDIDIAAPRRGQAGRIKNVYTNDYLVSIEAEAGYEPTIAEVVGYLEENKQRFHNITTKWAIEWDIDFLRKELYRSQLGVDEF